MGSEDIIAIIKWGPLLFFLLVFFTGLLIGLVKGRRKSTKKAIYSFLYLIVVFLCTPTITKGILSIRISGVSIAEIPNSDSMRDILTSIPFLENMLVNYISAFSSVLVFMILVLIKPIFFPVYIIYSIIYNIIYKKIFKYSKYQKDDDGKYLRNEKGKKIKTKEDKHRLTGGLIKGVEYTVLSSVIFTPIGVITRLYGDAKNATVSKDLSTIEELKDFKEYLNYIDAFNNSFVGKITNGFVSEKVAGYLTQVEIDGEKTTLEKELSNVVVAAVYLEESGLIELLSKDIDVKTLDLSKLKLGKIDLAIEKLFDTLTLKLIVSDGVNYVLENNLKDTLVDFSGDASIVDKLKYNNSEEVKEEILTVTKLVRDIINSRLLTIYQNSNENYIDIVNKVSTNDVEAILNKVLSIKILSRAMPSLASKYLEDLGLSEELKVENNDEFVSIIINGLKFVKTLEINHVDDISKGNVVDNLVNVLYKDGAIKENTRESLSKLLSSMTSSTIFDDILVTQLNKLLEKYEIKLNAQMLVNVKTPDDWKNELIVLEDICSMYTEYNENQTVDFLTATELIDHLKNSKAMILAFPISYQKLFPNIGIEVDIEKIKYIDYSQSNASEEERQFYAYWRTELTHLEVISEELAKLKISSISDVSLDLLNMDSNVVSLSNIIGEIFSSDLLKDGVTKTLNDLMADLVQEYDITLNEDAISNVNALIEVYPHYIVVGNEAYEIELSDNKYYINDEEVTIENGKVSYLDALYDVEDNSLSRIWKGELDNLATIVSVIKTGDYTNKENLSKILNSVDDMQLLKDVKNDLLIYAVKQINIIDTSSIDKTKVSFTKEKEILLNVIDKYDLLKDIATLDFKTIDDQKISDLSFVLDNVLTSDLFGEYAASNIVTVANKSNVALDNETVLNANTWESDLKLIRTALNMDENSFNKATMEALLTGIEDSSLLSERKEEVLLNTAKQINITGITISSSLTSDQLVYEDEKNAILVASENLSLLEDFAEDDFSLASVNSDDLSEVLAATMKSKMLSDSVVDNLVGVFNNNSIKHDLDTDTNAHLIASIRSINESDNPKQVWKNEIDLVKSLLEVNQKEEVNDALFVNIENNSVLMSGCKKNILLRMIKEINSADKELNLNTSIKANELSDTQYDIEKQVLIDLVSLVAIQKVEDIDATNKDDLANALDSMNDSVIFTNKYNLIVSDIVTSIEGNSAFDNWGISINSNPTIDDWGKELTALLVIKDNANEVNSMTLSTLNTTTIGDTLDQMDNSLIINGSEAAANAFIKKLTNDNSMSISKSGYDSWKGAFEAKLNS